MLVEKTTCSFTCDYCGVESDDVLYNFLPSGWWSLWTLSTDQKGLHFHFCSESCRTSFIAIHTDKKIN